MYVLMYVCRKCDNDNEDNDNKDNGNKDNDN